ncbi:hypothetical protein CYMTET_15697 [Cymbomonas tetramitiformis]|uniref:Uncharacterized protein n=1 Tax=Cymbomonas tetramitiformis TaxID=36881 RepID=A0AAE0GE30_9CHLO|nr:hypothetical protein CYMTET_15697 [Cymbomonas tetramitiformis]
MKGTLDVERSKRSGGYRNPKVIAAGVLGFGFVVGLLVAVSVVEKYLKEAPLLVFLLPFLGMFSLLLLLPLVVFVTYADDFSDVNPLKPKDYFYLMKKTFGALKEGKSRIQVKDL